MAENIATDWILINLKFSGKCVECGKEIKSGRALWSKSTKKIKHSSCSIRNGDQEPSGDHDGPATPKQETSTQRRYRKTIVQRCFICGKEEPVEDEYDSNGYQYLTDSKSQSYICQLCLQNNDAFEAYRQAFLQKNKRYMGRGRLGEFF
ncbi:hypothetical protein BH18THE2_BH18THE2_24160 [soil metagenome]